MIYNYNQLNNLFYILQVNAVNFSYPQIVLVNMMNHVEYVVVGLFHKNEDDNLRENILPPFDLPLLANYLSRVYELKDSGTAASVTQLRLRGTPFPKIT